MKSIRKTVENVLVMARGTPSGLVTVCVCKGELWCGPASGGHLTSTSVTSVVSGHLHTQHHQLHNSEEHWSVVWDNFRYHVVCVSVDLINRSSQGSYSL